MFDSPAASSVGSRYCTMILSLIGLIFSGRVAGCNSDAFIWFTPALSRENKMMPYGVSWNESFRQASIEIVQTFVNELIPQSSNKTWFFPKSRQVADEINGIGTVADVINSVTDSYFPSDFQTTFFERLRNSSLLSWQGSTEIEGQDPLYFVEHEGLVHLLGAQQMSKYLLQPKGAMFLSQCTGCHWVPQGTSGCHRVAQRTTGYHRAPRGASGCHRAPQGAIGCYRVPLCYAGCHRLP